MGIGRFLFKVLLAVLLTIAFICCVALCGCAGNGALAMKSSTVSDTSDSSITYTGAVVDPVELMAARAAEKEKVIRAEKEPWRIVAYSLALPLGIGLVCGIVFMLIWVKAYLARSPWDLSRKGAGDD